MTAEFYQASPIKRTRSTKAEVEARREALLDIIADGHLLTGRVNRARVKIIAAGELVRGT
jgi:hypothetical protein